MGVVPNSAGPVQTEQAFGAGGLRIQKRIIIGTEFGEWAEETSGKATRRYCTLLGCFALLTVTSRSLARRLRNHAWWLPVARLWHDREVKLPWLHFVERL